MRGRNTMLSRTASNLFWMGRHLERADTAARLLDVGQRITLLPNTASGYQNEWNSLLQASGTATLFAEKYGEISQENIEEFIFFDRDNPSSVMSCIERAREAGRIVRTALTSQVWDALNVAYQDLRKLEKTPRDRIDTGSLTDFTTSHTSTVRGAINATQLRNDGWHFMNLGYGLERADATARLLDVKYYVLLPRIEFVGSGLDTYQWQVILRALSAELGQTLPWDSLTQLRRALVQAVPHLAMIDQVPENEWRPLDRLDLGRASFRYAVKDFYLTNPIARSSPLMGELSRMAAARNATSLAAE